MAHETSIPFGGRLVNVVRVNPPAHGSTPPPQGPSLMQQAAASAENKALAERKHIECLMANLQNSLAHLQAELERKTHDLERLAVELAMTVASRFLHRVVEAGDFPFAAYVQEAMQRLDLDQPLTVTMHPQDMAMLQQKLGEDQRAPGRANLTWIGDAGLARGSCRVQARDLGMRFDLAERLAALGQRLEDVAGADGNAESLPIRPSQTGQPSVAKRGNLAAEVALGGSQ